LLDAWALIVLDIGTRPPGLLIADVRAGLRERAMFVRSALRFAAGVAALVLAAVIVAALAERALDFTILECWTLATALLVEQLVGSDIRSAFRRAGKHRSRVQ